MLAVFNPGESATKPISPLVGVVCTMAWASPVEDGTAAGLVGFVAAGVAIAHADQFGRTGERESDLVVGHRHDPSLGVDDLDGNHGKIGIVRGESGAICDQAKRGGRAGGFAFGLDRRALADAFGDELAGRVAHLPFEVMQWRDGLFTL